VAKRKGKSNGQNDPNLPKSQKQTARTYKSESNLLSLLETNKDALNDLLTHGQFTTSYAISGKAKKLSAKELNETLFGLIDPDLPIGMLLGMLGVPLPRLTPHADGGRVVHLRPFWKQLLATEHDPVRSGLVERALMTRLTNEDLVPRNGSQFFGSGPIVALLALKLWEMYGPADQIYTSSAELVSYLYSSVMPERDVTVHLTGTEINKLRGTAQLKLKPKIPPTQPKDSPTQSVDQDQDHISLWEWDDFTVHAAFITAASITAQGGVSTDFKTKLTATEMALANANHIVILVPAEKFQIEQQGPNFPLAKVKPTAKVYLIADEQPKRWCGSLKGLKQEQLTAAWLDEHGGMHPLEVR
jgi:hypothetical protein